MRVFSSCGLSTTPHASKLSGESLAHEECLSTRCCEARKSLGSAGTSLDIYLIIASAYKSLISGGQ